MQEDIKNLKGLEIFLWYNCNLNCKFCFQKNLRIKNNKNLSYDEVIEIIDSWYKKWKKNIFFSWWDPLLDLNLQKYIIYSKEIWYNNIRIHTNWIILSSLSIFEKYIKAWANWFIISIHWYWPIHDLLVNSTWSFEKVKKALLNFVELKKKYPYIIIDTNTVLTRYNYTNLYVLFKFLSLFPITRSQLVQLYSLNLFSAEEKKNLYVTYKDFNIYLDKILDLKNINITLENFPFCEVSKKSFEHIIRTQKYNNDAYWYIWVDLDDTYWEYIKKCENCEYKNICNWFPVDYLQIFSENM